MIDVTKLDGFSGLKEEWNSLLKKSVSDNLFLTWEWQYNCWKYFQNNRELLLLLVKENDELIGIAPLCKSRVVLYGATLSSIEFTASRSPLDYLDFIIKKGSEGKVILAISDYLKKLDWDCIILDNVLSLSPAPQIFIKEFKGFYSYLENSGSSTSAMLPNLFKEYISSLGASTKKNYKRYFNKLNSDFNVSFDVATKDNFEEYLDAFLKLHAKRFEGKKDGFTDTMVDFVKSVSEDALNSGSLRLYSLKLNGEHKSLLQCFVYNNKIYHYNGGFDINYNNYDIGFIRFLYSIEHAISEGIIEFDFLKGVEEYKHRLGNKTIPVSRVVILRKNSKGYFVSSVKSTKNFIKKIIGL